jgi:hypothetical protein
MTVTNALETRDYLLELIRDETASNPLTEFDGMWSVVSFNRGGAAMNSLTTDRDRDEYFPMDAKGDRYPVLPLRNKIKAGTAFILDRNYYDHTWTVDADAVTADTDFSRVDGVIVWEHPPGDMGVKTREDRARDACGTLTEYNAWITGDVWGYSLSYREGSPITAYTQGDGKGGWITREEREDSCFGYYTFDHLLEVLRDEVLPGYAKKGPMRVKITGDGAEQMDYYSTLDNLPGVEIVKRFTDDGDDEIGDDDQY